MSDSPVPTPVLDLTVSSIDLTQAICDIESVSGNEAPLADAIEHALASSGHLEVIRVGNTVVARTSGGKAKRAIIAGHIDTVPVNANLPTRFETIDGREYLWGRGTADMKSGVAVQLKLAAELTDPAIDVTWMWYDGEEVESERNGLGILARERPDLFVGDFAILGEPTRSDIEGGCNGNTQGVAKLAEGRDVNEVISLIEGRKCGFKNTSCPAQLAEALKKAKAKI